MLFRNITYVCATNFVKGLLGLVVVPLAIHSLGISGYGLFSIYLIISSYNQFFELGVSRNLSRLLAGVDSYEEKTAHLKVALGLFFFIATAIIILSPIIIYLISRYLFPVPSQESSVLRHIIVLSILDYLLSMPVSLRQIYCTSKEDFLSYSKFLFYSGLYRYGLMFVGFVLFHRADLVIAFTTIFRFLDIFFGRKILGILPPNSWVPSFNGRKIFNMLAQSGVLSGSQILQILLISITPILTNRFLGLEALGIYQAMFNVANKMWFFSNSAGLVIFTRFVKFIGVTSLQKQQVVLSILLKANWLMYCVIGSLAICFTPLVVLVLHIKTLNNNGLLMFLFLAMAMNAHSDLAYNYLLSKAKYGTTVMLSFFGLLLMTIGFFVFKNKFGLIGVGITWLITQVIYSLCIDTAAMYKLLQQDFVFKVIALVCALLVLLSGMDFLPLAIKYLITFILLIWLCLYCLQNYKQIKQILY